MTNRFFRMALIAATMSFLGAGTALAKSSHSKTVRIDVLYPSRIANGSELKPGNYKMEVANNATKPEVMFYENNKLVAQAPAQLVAGEKSADTEVHYTTTGDEHVITQIDLKGWTEKVMFNSSGSTRTGT